MVVWTETRLKIIQILLRIDQCTLHELAEEIGFINPENLNIHLHVLVRQKYLLVNRGENLNNPTYILNKDIPAVTRLYHDGNYRQIQENIRSNTGIIHGITAYYDILPSELLVIIQEMVRLSHSFFMDILENPTPDQLEKTYRFMRYPFRMITGITDELTVVLLIHELYAVAIARDLKKGGLANGFCEPIKKIRKYISDQYGMSPLKEQQYQNHENLAPRESSEEI